MSLSQKTSAIVFLTVVGLMAVLYATTRILMLRSFLALEQDETRSAVQRAENALNDDLSGLAATANDYAAWDLTYQFMQQPSRSYIHQQFESDTLHALGIDSVLIVDNHQKILFFIRYDLGKHEAEVPTESEAALASDLWVRATGTGSTPRSGILALPQGPALVAACPILTSQRTGTSRGVLVMTRNLNRDRVNHWMAVTRSSITFRSYGSLLAAPDFRKARETIEASHQAIVVQPLSDQIVAGYTSVRDAHGKPVLLLRLDTPRTVFQQGAASLHYFLGALALVSVAFGLMTLLLLRQAVLSPLNHLNAEVIRVAERKNLSERVEVRGRDELANLGRAINIMLEALQRSDTHFRQIAENIHQVFWVRDAVTQEIAYISLAYEDVWGRTRQDLYADSRSWRDAIHFDDREAVAEMLQQQGRGKIGSTEYRIVRPDGNIRWICDRYFPVSDGAGRLMQIAGLAEDITEFKKAEQVLLRSHEELENLVRERTIALAKANHELRAEVSERKQAEQALGENARLASLGAAIGAALSRASTLRSGLQQCAEAFVAYIDAAFARVWTLNEASTILELEASAGMYTHVDGPHGRVPVGAMKIGRIAQSRQPHLTNDVAHDPQVSDPQWAKREGMVSFAGCPLIVEGGVVGVVAAFARKPLSKATLECFASVADQIAQFIQRMRMQAALHASEEHFRQLFATIPVPIWLYEQATLRFLEVNDAAVEHYGYSREEFLQMTIEEIRPEGERERLRQNLSRPRPSKSVSRGWKHRTKAGTIIEVEINSHQVRFTGVPAVLVAAQDVTQRSQMEVELRHGQKLQAVGELAAGIAHEINTPIQFVGDNVRFLHNAFSALIKLLDVHERLYAATEAAGATEQSNEMEAARKASDIQFLRKEIPAAVGQTLDGVRRVATIVQALKKFSHADSGPEKAAADLNDALQSTLVVARNELKYVAEVETKFADMPPVLCHLGDLNQVFLNLLVNAAHSIGETVKQSGTKGRIRVETKTEGDCAVVAISDTGAGIPLEIRDRIFEPFFTTKVVGKGSGQGLALARAIVVDKHGGTLTFESEPGKGATFYVRIPIHGVPLPERVDAEMRSTGLVSS